MASENNVQERFINFTDELELLSKKYGVVLQAVGGVYFCDIDDPDLKKLQYDCDSSSGDLLPLNYFNQ